MSAVLVVSVVLSSGSFRAAADERPLSTEAVTSPPNAAPVIETGVPAATADKPQSKVWHAQGCWWAWLPSTGGGSRVWRRSLDGSWRAESHLDDALRALPSRADVLAEDRRVVAALVDGNQLAVASLLWIDAADRYELEPECPLGWRETRAVETVTIDRAADGTLWIAYPADRGAGRSIIARRAAADASALLEERELASGLYSDEICATVALRSETLVLWSDQLLGALVARRWSTADERWSDAEIIVQSEHAADDHINFAVPSRSSPKDSSEISGARAWPRLIVVSKNEHDSVGRHQLALDSLSAEGHWTRSSFATLEAGSGEHPTRPIVLWLGARPVVVYTDGRNARTIEFDAQCRSPLAPSRIAIAGGEGVAAVNNATGPKVAPPGPSCVVLVSDGAGRVFEMVLE